MAKRPKTLLALAILLTLSGCKQPDQQSLACKAVVADAVQYRSLLQKLKKREIKIKERGKNSVFYLCSEAERVEEALNEVNAHFNPGCSFYVRDEAKRLKFLSALEEANVAYWVVPSGDGERINCDLANRSEAWRIFDSVYFSDE